MSRHTVRDYRTRHKTRHPELPRAATTKPGNRRHQTECKLGHKVVGRCICP